MVGDDVAHEGERQPERVRRDLADAVVRRIGDPDTVLRAGVGVHGVETGADPAHDADVGQRRDDAFGDGGVLQQDGGAVARGRDHVGVGFALRGDELGAGRGEEIALESDIGIIVVGEKDLGHEVSWVDRGRLDGRLGTGDAQRYVAPGGLVKRSDRFVRRSQGGGDYNRPFPPLAGPPFRRNPR